MRNRLKQHVRQDPTISIQLPSWLIEAYREEGRREGFTRSAAIRRTLLDKYRNLDPLISMNAVDQ
jgi:hypothetical protein